MAVRARLDRIKPGESYLVPVSREMLSRKDPLLLERIVRLDSQRERNEQETKLARSIERLENELVGFTKTAEGIRGELQKITAARTVAPAPVAVDIYREERAGRADVTLPQDTWPWRAIVAIGIISALIAGVLIVLVTLYRRRSEQVLERDRETGYVHTVAREPLRSEEGSEEEIERVELHQLRDDYERLRQWQTEHTPGYVLEKTVNGVTERFVLDAYRRNKDGKPVREFESPLTTGVGGYVLEDNLTSHMKKNHPELKNRPLPNAA